MSFLSTATGVGVVDARTRPGTITLPLTSQIPNRYLQFKDLYGAFNRSSLTLSTQFRESFDDGTTTKVFTEQFTFLTLYAASTTKWAVMGGTQTIQQTVSSLTVSSITIGSGLGWLQMPPIQTVALSTNTINADTVIVNSTTSMYISAQILYVSSIMGAAVSGGGGTGDVTKANLASTTQALQSAPTQFVSSLTVNAITVGTGAGWLQLPPLQTIYASTTYVQGQALYTLSSYFGTGSTMTALQFYGLFSNYNNTVIAEVSTGVGTQELLLFKGSSTSDRVRVQTTGNFVVETGISARLWDSSALTIQSNATPAFIINTSSNVGIQTASPQTTLDVAGTGRFQTVSTQSLLTSTTSALSAFSISSITSTLLINGTGLAKFNGTNSGTSYGLGVDTFTLQSSSNSYLNAIASLAFATNTASYPLGRIYAFDTATSGSAVSQLIFQTVPVSANSFTSNFTYTGADQSFTVPTGTTLIQVTMWGAGGSGGNNGPGGAGAFVQGLLTVTAGQVLNLIVGQGGVFNSATSSYGGGGAGSNLGYTGSGGGRSAIQMTLTATISSASGSGSAITYTTNVAHGLQVNQPVIISGLSPSGFNGTYVVASTPLATTFTVLSSQAGSSTGTGTIVAELVNIGGGGAGPQNAGGSNGGAATFSGTAFSAPTVWGGGGGTQTAGGAAGTSGSSPGATAGSLLQGGAGSLAGGGGGGGYYGGGGGGWTSAVSNGGGGGGSSYTSYTLFSLQVGSNSPNSSNQAPATSAPSYQAGVAVGGAVNTSGGAGLIVINSFGGSMMEAMRIGSNGFLGIQTTSPGATLDVAGTGRFQAVSTLALNISTINGQVYSPGTGGGGGAISYLSSYTVSTGSVFASTLTTSSILNTGGISTHSLTVYGPSTLTVQGYAYFTSIVSSFSLVTGNVGLIDSVTQEPVYIQAANGSVTLNGSAPLTQPIINSTIEGLGTFGYLSSGGGGGITSLPLNISTLTLSTVSLYTTNSYLGATSDATEIQFYGTSGTYDNSVIAEISTGSGTQEMLFFKGSTTTDRFRFQTTGNFVVETGVSARLFASTTVNTLSNATPAFIINTSSNVGIQTATPATTLDVAGSGRFIEVSTITVRTNVFYTNTLNVAIQTI